MNPRQSRDAPSTTPGRFFPDVSNREEFDRIARNEALLGPGIAAICSELGLREAPQRFKEGSLPVYAVGDLVLKAYPPQHIEEREREGAVLEILEGRLPIPTPALRGQGELEGWGYVVMERLRGATWAEKWLEIPRAEQERLAGQLGEALAVLHAVRHEGLRTLHEPWSEFVERQRRTAVERQRSRNLAPQWLEQVDDFLAETPLSDGPSDCLLHTEVMREHLLVAPGPNGFEFSGLVDFEPSTIGAAEYEFGAIGVFLTCADAVLLRRVLLGYGYAPADLDESLARRFLAYKILHRYSNLAWYLERVPPPAWLTRLADLANYWWGFG